MGSLAKILEQTGGLLGNLGQGQGSTYPVLPMSDKIGSAWRSGAAWGQNTYFTILCFWGGVWQFVPGVSAFVPVNGGVFPFRSQVFITLRSLSWGARPYEVLCFLGGTSLSFLTQATIAEEFSKDCQLSSWNQDRLNELSYDNGYCPKAIVLSGRQER